MGRAFRVKCSACQHAFPASEGGGVRYQSVRCKKCGRDEDVLHEDIQDTNLAYLKGLNPVMAEMDGSYGRTYPGEPITPREFPRRVVAKAGVCECGGRFSFTAPLRCPACGSVEVADDGTLSVQFD